MTLRPSETQAGLAWLENFLPEERHTAELLINSIRVISATAFRAYMAELLLKVKSDLQRPIAFYPIRELPKGLPQPDVPSKQAISIEQKADGDLVPLLPLDNPFESLPGSEGIVGNIIRDTIGHRPIHAVASSPRNLEDLKKAKPRTIVLVDDYSGTGTRVAGYVDSWMRHKTIRSWYSYGLIKFHIALVTASGIAIEKLEGHSRITGVHYREQAADFSTSMWSDEEREKVIGLCEKYAYRQQYELGYQRAAGLLILQHTVPNNLPAILWQRSVKSRPDWKPLFSDRRMTPQLQVDLDDYKLEIDAAAIADSMGQFSLGIALPEQPNPTARMIFLVLAAAAHRIRDPTKLSLVLHTSIVAADRTQQACKNLNLLDEQGRLTDLGRTELRRVRARGDAIRPTRLKGSRDPYYPTQLRGVSEI
jgi:hypothetical protein